MSIPLNLAKFHAAAHNKYLLRIKSYQLTAARKKINPIWLLVMVTNDTMLSVYLHLLDRREATEFARWIPTTFIRKD